MSSVKPIVLYAHASGPNPGKVAIILEELGIPYEPKYIEFPDMKKEPFISINPNGRVPAIEDPNTGVTLWESGAIIRYLLEQYDKDAKLQYTSSPEKYEQVQWEHFQSSGQGPYFGQKAWFTFYHPEKNLTSVLDRYAKEIERVIGVIDLHLTRTGKPYLVGDKVTYADLMFVMWINMLPFIYPELDTKKFEKFTEWFGKLSARESVKKVLDDRQKAMAAAKH